MTLINTLARLEAFAADRAQPVATVLHRHLAPRPLVLVPLTTAGEAGAPLGVLVGTDPDRPTVLCVPQPRDRDLRFAFLAELAEVVLPHLESAQDEVEPQERRETDPETGRKVAVQVELCVDAPQLLVPNEPGVEYVRLLGRSTRFRRTAERSPEDGYPPESEPVPADAVPARVPLLGRWLTHYGERARVPGSSLLLSMTGLLTRHWATGQSHLEDQHLGALLGWIDPPDGLGGAEAARRAEQQRDAEGRLLVPPAGPATDPVFDNTRLAPAIARYDAAFTVSAQRRAEAELRELLYAQMRPTWDAMWRGVTLLRRLPVASRVADRWKRDRWSYTGHRDRVRAGEPPQPRRDDAVTAARKLASRETAQAQLEAQEALDDPLVLAGRRLAGEAFVGAVTKVRMEHSEGRRPMPRPLVTLLTEDRPQLVPGTRLHRALGDGRPQGAECVEVTVDDPAAGPQRPAEGEPSPPADPHGPLLVVVRLTGGMGRGRVPEPGSVPEPGEVVCWTLFAHAPRGGPELPEPEETPWTHGGPVLAESAGDPAPDPVTDEDFL